MQLQRKIEYTRQQNTDQGKLDKKNFRLDLETMKAGRLSTIEQLTCLVITEEGGEGCINSIKQYEKEIALIEKTIQEVD